MSAQSNKFLGAMLLILAVVAWSLAADCDQLCRMRTAHYGCKSGGCCFYEKSSCFLCQPKGQGVCAPLFNDTPDLHPACKYVRDAQGQLVRMQVWQYETCAELKCDCESFEFVEADLEVGDYSTFDTPRMSCEVP